MTRLTEKQKRAAKRRLWPGQKATLDQNADAGDCDHITAAERVAAVWQMTLDAWAMSGKKIPAYSRAETPGRVIRPKVC